MQFIPLYTINNATFIFYLCEIYSHLQYITSPDI